MKLRRRWIALVLATGLLATAGVAEAQGNEAQAKIHYQRGVDLYTDGAYTAALAELEKAYALSPHYRVLYSLALVRSQLSDFVGALRGFQEYLAAAVDESPQRKAEVKERIEQLQTRVAQLTVKVNVDDAEVYIDDELKGTSPFPQAILVNPGKHQVYAKKGGTKSESKALVLNAGSQNRIALEVEGPAAPAATANQPNPNPEPPPKGESSSATTIGLVATGIFTAGAITTGVLTLVKRGDLEDAQAKPNTPAQLESASDGISTMALVTDILIGAAVIAGGFTVYTVLKKKEPKAAASRSWVTVTPSGFRF